MLNKNQKPIWRNKFLVTLIFISLSANFFVICPLAVKAEDEKAPAETEIKNDEVEALNQRIEDKRREIDILQKEIDGYKENIKTQQQETKSLKNQVAILNNQIAKVNLDVTSTEKTIEETNLQIQALNLQIQETEKEIAGRKEKIAQYLRLIYQNDQVSYLEVMLTNESFSNFFDQIKYAEEIHDNLNLVLEKIKKNKQDLEIQKANWEEKAGLEEKLKGQLQEQKADLTEKNTAQSLLLIQAKLTEKQYQNYLYQLQVEQQQVNAEITGLEKSIREKLEALAEEEKFRSFGPARLGWPVNPSRGITAYFHDPDYPFRYIFEHPGIDIRVSQGTPIGAAEAGYVGRVSFKGNKSYAYIMLIHSDGLATVYGHVSSVNVKEDQYVTKGQLIGRSGGLPGTTGAGNLSTGAHLHFEVRLNGIPVNPLEYLPGI